MHIRFFFQLTRVLFIIFMICMQNKYPLNMFANAIAVMLLVVCFGSLIYLGVRIRYERSHYGLSRREAHAFREVYSFCIDILFLMAQIVVAGLYGPLGHLLIIVIALIIMECVRIGLKQWISKWRHTYEESISEILLSRLTEEQLRAILAKGSLTGNGSLDMAKGKPQERELQVPHVRKRKTNIVKFDRSRLKQEKNKKKTNTLGTNIRKTIIQ